MNKNREGFLFEGIHTEDFDLELMERDAPPPTEKEIIEEVPFMQGVHDFSMFLGERIFGNRPLTYKFKTQASDYQKMKTKKTVITNRLMKNGIKPLYDDFDKGYVYMAKCTGVDFTIKPTGYADVLITFTAYPFKKAELEEGNDIWDTFNFELDVFQEVEYTINGSETIILMNVGSTGVTPRIIANSSFTIMKGNVTYNISSGETKSESFRIEVGENEMTLEGNGTIKFEFYKELL